MSESNSMSTLRIVHIPGEGEPRFNVVRPDGRPCAEPVVAPSPYGFTEGLSSNVDLMMELRWYLETFLDWPYSPETERADRLLNCLKHWGEAVYGALFSGRQAMLAMEQACEAGLDRLCLDIASDDPSILSWPWEALKDPESPGPLAHQCQMRRRLGKTRDPFAVSEKLPRDRVNILLVTARPFAGDVAYRSVSRPLVELIQENGLPARVHVLRPPTWPSLEAHLRERRDYYHVLHFDGHGAYLREAEEYGDGDRNSFRAFRGHLVFENDEGAADLKKAGDLATLLQEYHIPLVVLNSCQSGMLDEQAADPMASVATALMAARVGSVTAMAYSLYVSAARVFLPAFYRRLFETRDPAVAARAGRRAMLGDKGRVSYRGPHPLEDWLVPVLYQQSDLRLPAFEGHADEVGADEVGAGRACIPEEARLPRGLHFAGREQVFLALERALRSGPPVVLIHGLGGVGKTTLARAFLQWLADTGGLAHPPQWIGFAGVNSADYVINELLRACGGEQIVTRPMAERIAILTEGLRQVPLLLVFDNFESARGLPEAGAPAHLPDEDQACIKRFLEGLRGGMTRVLITSRSREDWLGALLRPLPLGGLRGEERAEFIQSVLRELGLEGAVDRDDKDFARLMESLDGHPLSTRALLPLLRDRSPARVLQSLQANLADLANEENEEMRKVFAALRFVEDSLAPELRPLLVPLSLHERYVQEGLSVEMIKMAKQDIAKAELRRFLEVMIHAGLLFSSVIGGLYAIHPALSGYLRGGAIGKRDGKREMWERAFVDTMGQLADHFTHQRPKHERRDMAEYHGANCRAALALAEGLDMLVHAAALTQFLALLAQEAFRFDEAERFYLELASLHGRHDNHKGLAKTYHQLGMVAQERGDLSSAEVWYRKSLGIEEKLGNKSGMAITFHQLGVAAQKRGDLSTAEAWYHKSLKIKKKLDDEQGLASTYHQLGIVAQKRGDWSTAQAWYVKSLEIEEKLNNEPGLAITYHQLGNLADSRGDLSAAEAWYRKSLVIEEKLGNEPEIAGTYHQLGIVAQERGDLSTSEAWYRRALVILEKLGNEPGMTGTYHQLGSVAHQRGDLSSAEAWYRKSLEIGEKLNNEPGLAITYHQLGIVAQERGDLSTSEAWCRRALVILEKLGNEPGMTGTYHQLGMVAHQRGDLSSAEAWYRKSLGIDEKLGNEPGMAITYHQLGRVAQERGALSLAEEWYRKSLVLSEKLSNEIILARTLYQLGNVANKRGDYMRAGDLYMKSKAIFKRLGIEPGGSLNEEQFYS